MTPALLSAGAGFLGSAHCAAMCGPLQAAAGVRAVDRALWQAGRLTAYVGLGALAGGIGGVRVVSSPVGPILALTALAWFAADLAGLTAGRPLLGRFAARLASVPAAMARRAGPGARFLFGLATALLPCGLLWSGLAMAATTGSAALGAAGMAAFFLGTLPAVGLAGATARLLSGARPWTRRAFAAGVFALGIWSISLRAGWQAPAAPDSAPCHANGGVHVP